MGEGDLTGQPQIDPARIDAAEKRLRLGLVARDIGDRAAHQWRFALGHGAALQQLHNVARLTAAEQVNDHGVGLALGLPNLRLGGRDRRADGVETIG